MAFINSNRALGAAILDFQAAILGFQAVILDFRAAMLKHIGAILELYDRLRYKKDFFQTKSIFTISYKVKCMISKNFLCKVISSIIKS